MPAIKVKDLTGNVIYSTSDVDGESADEAFYCILEQEMWVQDEILADMGLPTDGSFCFSHPTWRVAGGATPRDDNSVVEILNNGIHIYNVILE